MKILVVDDDATNRLILKGLLSKEGHETIMAENGAEAVQLFEDNSPDMVLMDVMMPVMDGYEATKLIKSKSGDQFVPVIFLTAMGGDEAMVACLDNGGDDYIKKPFTRLVLNAKIEAMNRIRLLYQMVQDQKVKLTEQQKHIEREHEIAEKIFSNIMARGDSSLPIIKSYRESAETFNGDIVLAARNAQGGFNLLVGDFTGHGLAAAIGAMPVADTFFAMAGKGLDLEDIITEINKKVRQLLPSGRFLAAILLHVDSQCRIVKVWNGGMPEILLINDDGKNILKRVESNMLPLGILSPVDFISTPQIVEIKHGSHIVIFSDGVIETTNAEAQMFGIERVEHIVTHFDNSQRVEELRKSLASYRGDQPQMDDITIVDIACDPNLFLQLNEEKRDSRAFDSTNWRISFSFEEDTLRKLDPLPLFMDALSNIQGLFAHKEKLFLILSELYNNALEHGILNLTTDMKSSPEGFSKYYEERGMRLLKLEKARIDVEFVHQPSATGGALKIRVADTGNGFDTTRLSKKTMQENIGYSGRGIELIQNLCQSIEYNAKGNEVVVVYPWNV